MNHTLSTVLTGIGVLMKKDQTQDKFSWKTLTGTLKIVQYRIAFME